MFQKLLMLSLIGFFLSSCTSLLYHPTRIEHVKRDLLPVKPEDITFASEDGTKLHAWRFKATRGKPANCAILFFHGNAQNLSTHFFSLYKILDYGYDYMIFDYRGYGSSEGQPTPKGTVEDGRAAVREITKLYPNKKIVIFAQSLGGAIALRTAIDMKEEVRPALIVADSTFISYRSVARRVMAQGWLTWIFQPIGWLAMNDRYAPGDEVAKLSPTPLLVIHGDQDRGVTIANGEDLFEAAREPKEFWRIAGGQHIDSTYREKGKYFDQLVARLDRECR